MNISSKRGAELSECRTFRYTLWRWWSLDLPAMVFIMLNPSTADASEEDQTIRKCIGFAERNGCGGIVVVNLFAFRTKDPEILKEAGYQIGPDNDNRILLACSSWGEGTKVVCAWGSHAAKHMMVQKRVRRVLDILRDEGITPLVLALNAGDIPAHPCMLGYDNRPMGWLPWLKS